ncbi:MAG: DPP IV N-terminal domain-containing protein, partial [Myxococcales bacterium]|nr:DPP IV N-terminal domain-containing protein [Myxococcales bacterium]
LAFGWWLSRGARLPGPEQIPSGGIVFQAFGGDVHAVALANATRDRTRSNRIHPSFSLLGHSFVTALRSPESLAPGLEQLQADQLRFDGDGLVAHVFGFLGTDGRLVRLDPCGRAVSTRAIGEATFEFDPLPGSGGTVLLLRPVPETEGGGDSTLSEVVALHPWEDVAISLGLPPVDARAGLAASPDGRSIVVGAPGGILRVVSLVGETPIEIGPGVQGAWAPDGGRVAYMHDQDLWIFDLASGERRLLHHIDPGIEWGVVHERLWWSPDGRFLAYNLDGSGLGDSCRLLELSTERMFYFTGRTGSCGPFLTEEWLARREDRCELARSEDVL